MTDNQEIEKVEQVEIQKTAKSLNVTALVSMISGILTYAFFLFGRLINIDFVLAAILAPITALTAIITGSIAKRKIRQSDGLLGGKKMANTGLWLGWIYIIICVLVLVLVLAGVSAILSAVTGLFN